MRGVRAGGDRQSKLATWRVTVRAQTGRGPNVQSAGAGRTAQCYATKFARPTHSGGDQGTSISLLHSSPASPYGIASSFCNETGGHVRAAATKSAAVALSAALVSSAAHLRPLATLHAPDSASTTRLPTPPPSHRGPASAGKGWKGVRRRARAPQGDAGGRLPVCSTPCKERQQRHRQVTFWDSTRCLSRCDRVPAPGLSFCFGAQSFPRTI